jgi:hypothetical protein
MNTAKSLLYLFQGGFWMNSACSTIIVFLLKNISALPQQQIKTKMAKTIIHFRIKNAKKRRVISNILRRRLRKTPKFCMTRT